MKRPDASSTPWHVATRLGKRSALDMEKKSHNLINEVERFDASELAKAVQVFA